VFPFSFPIGNRRAPDPAFRRSVRESLRVVRPDSSRPGRARALFPVPAQIQFASGRATFRDLWLGYSLCGEKKIGEPL
jgi:hypothetical protein